MKKLIKEVAFWIFSFWIFSSFFSSLSLSVGKHFLPEEWWGQYVELHSFCSPIAASTVYIFKELVRCYPLMVLEVRCLCKCLTWYVKTILVDLVHSFRILNLHSRRAEGSNHGLSYSLFLFLMSSLSGLEGPVNRLLPFEAITKKLSHLLFASKLRGTLVFTQLIWILTRSKLVTSSA